MEEYITILDFTNAEIHIHKFNPKDYPDISYLLDKLGYDESNIEYLVNKTLKLQIHG